MKLFVLEIRLKTLLNKPAHFIIVPYRLSVETVSNPSKNLTAKSFARTQFTSLNPHLQPISIKYVGVAVINEALVLDKGVIAYFKKTGFINI
ncbi:MULTISPECIES: hypothetical protein [unclassified Halomonas]|uniref:hypothetical protein n=1 Tax=unclassified Halomonas TaxID=2609666 RepID=UPI0020769214|nr:MULTISPECIES: hypothetical protein [unclassified Halomonas]